jgi:hypothetical protein
VLYDYSLAEIEEMAKSADPELLEWVVDDSGLHLTRR